MASITKRSYMSWQVVVMLNTLSEPKTRSSRRVLIMWLASARNWRTSLAKHSQMQRPPRTANLRSCSHPQDWVKSHPATRPQVRLQGLQRLH